MSSIHDSPSSFSSTHFNFRHVVHALTLTMLHDRMYFAHDVCMFTGMTGLQLFIVSDRKITVGHLTSTFECSKLAFIKIVNFRTHCTINVADNVLPS